MRYDRDGAPIKDIADTLEAMVDKEGLMIVLSALAEVCELKAAHLTDNWQDKESAKQWDKTRKALERVELSDAVRSVS